MLAAKRHRRGTHRTVSPRETLRRFGRHAAALGITRVADITGLDYLGVPVFMAVRPNARSLSVAQGKGLDADAARTSAFMEAAELDHAERLSCRVVVETHHRLRARARVVDPAQLPRLRGTAFAPQKRIAWVVGHDLATGEPVHVPRELVDADFTTAPRAEAGCFLRSTNGLASGNHRLEALCAGLSEVIERDATFLFDLLPDHERIARRLRLAGVADPDCRALIDTLTDQGMSVAVWDATSDIGVACFACRIGEAPGNDRSHFGAFWGYGCHLSRTVALARAITEAVQSRLTCIAGSRDDLRRRDFAEPDTESSLLMLACELREERAAGCRFADVPDFQSTDFAADLARLLASLRGAGLDQVIAVDLTRATPGIPVTRVIVPGLEVAASRGHCAPGRRARAFAKARR